MPVCDGVPSLQWFLVPSLDSCSLESCRLQSCCPEARRVLCEQHTFCVSSTAQPHSCQNHSLGGCGATVEMSASQKVCREIIPGCSSRPDYVGLIFFLGCCETAFSVHIISELLACPAREQPCPAPPGALCPLPGWFPGLFISALLSCSLGRVVPEQ